VRSGGDRTGNVSSTTGQDFAFVELPLKASSPQAAECATWQTLKFVSEHPPNVEENRTYG